MTITRNYVGPNTAAPGVYSTGRESAGPNAFDLRSGDVLVDCSAKFTNRDVLYAGTPNAPLRENITATNIVGHDAGRHFFGCVHGKNITVHNWWSGPCGLDVLDVEPSVAGNICENIVMRQGTVGGRVHHFLIASKGIPGRPVSVVTEDVRTNSAGSVGNVLWAHANWAPPEQPAVRSFTLRRVNMTVRADVTDHGRFRDRYGEFVTPSGNRTRPIVAWNCDLILEDVYVNGRPITIDDVQWRYTNSRGEPEGREPIIRFTDSTTPPPPPVDTRDEEIAALTAQVAALTAQVESLTTQRGDLNDQIGWLHAVIDALVKRIDAAKLALG